METSTESETIVHTILDLAANLGLAVTAEGIETAFSAEHLKALGCANGQGLLFGKPTDAHSPGLRSSRR
jgi:EAL domain-containing protein (putative c-di-GMP-specific phosphodiesterase class I)